jgi:hypothetical protein
MMHFPSRLCTCTYLSTYLSSCSREQKHMYVYEFLDFAGVHGDFFFKRQTRHVGAGVGISIFSEQGKQTINCLYA